MRTTLRIRVGERVGEISALVDVPSPARLLYVLAHGAGAGMEHPFLESFVQVLAEHGLATLRYQFPYMEAGRRRPDPPAVLQATVRAAIATAARTFPDLPRIAGGKSMGGRMTSQAIARGLVDESDVLGLAFLGFPLHPAGKPQNLRGEHLAQVDLPMLFLQGSRDALADLDLLTPLVQKLGATLHVVAGGDHSFTVLKRSGRTQAEVLRELATTLVGWEQTLKR